MKAKFSVLAACLAVACATVAQAGDRLYFTQDSGSNDTISKVNSLTRGVMGGGIGSEAGFAAGGTGTDNLGDIAAANINGTPVIATAGNVIHTWDADINFVNVTDVNGGAPDVPIREIAVGEMGGNADRLVIARGTIWLRPTYSCRSTKRLRSRIFITQAPTPILAMLQG